MIAFYVQGGGLGHLARTEKLIYTLGLKTDEFLIITPSQFCHYFPQFTFVHLAWDDAIISWQETISKTFVESDITHCYVDAFPLGINGELIPIYNDFKNISFTYVARILKWEKYISSLSPFKKPFFQESLLLETLYDSHKNWIKQTSEKVTQLSLKQLPLPELTMTLQEPYELIVHSGGKKDVLALCDFVQKQRLSRNSIYVFTQVDLPIMPANFSLKKDVYRVGSAFAKAEKIYTAGGFNLMNELKEYRNKHVAIPLERMYDDQAFRIKTYSL